MPINFVQLLQDSWNFMRNQRQFVLTGILLLLGLQLANAYFSTPLALPAEGEASPKALQEILQTQLLPTLIYGLMGIALNVLIVLNIQSINQGQYQHFFQNMGAMVKRFFPALCLEVVMFLPLSVALSLGMTLSGAGVFAIPLMLAALFIFSKLCLVLYVYLLEEPQKSVGESITFCWSNSRGKMRFLVPFIIIAYVMPNLLSTLILQIMGGEIAAGLSQLFSSIVSLFLLIFSFRFYQAFRALPIK